MGPEIDSRNKVIVLIGWRSAFSYLDGVARQFIQYRDEPTAQLRNVSEGVYLAADAPDLNRIGRARRHEGWSESPAGVWCRKLDCWNNLVGVTPGLRQVRSLPDLAAR